MFVLDRIHRACSTVRTRRVRDWEEIVERSSRPQTSPPVPGSSTRQDPPILEDSDSEEEVRDSLEPSEDESPVAKLCREGGVAFSHFLVSKRSHHPLKNPPPKNGHTVIYYDYPRRNKGIGGLPVNEN